MKKTIKSQLIDFVQANGPTTRRDIIKYLRETIQGKDFDPVRDRGYYCVPFYATIGPFSTRQGYMTHPSKCDRRYLKKIEKGLYVAVDPLQ
jgi:hypothetical protein